MDDMASICQEFEASDWQILPASEHTCMWYMEKSSLLYCVQQPPVSLEDCSLGQAVGFTLFSFLPRSTGSGISICTEMLFYYQLPLWTMTFLPSHDPGWPFLELPLHMHSKTQILIYIFWFVTRFSAFEGLFIFNISFGVLMHQTVSGAQQHSTNEWLPPLSSLLSPPSSLSPLPSYLLLPPFLPSSPSFTLSFPLFPSSLALINQDEK